MNNNKENNNNKETLKEVKLSWIGRLFFAGVSAQLAGSAMQGWKAGKLASKIPINVRGTPQQVEAILQILVSSKAFQQAASTPNSTIEDIVNKLKIRNLNKKTFERLTGHKWPI